jgi:hypothetical protein
MTPIALRTPSSPGPSTTQTWPFNNVTSTEACVSTTRASRYPFMSTTTSENMSSLAGTAGASRLPTQLNRELSQQELDAAQQLIEHSQSIPRRHSPESAQGGEQMQDARSGEGGENGVPSQEHHDLSDSMLGYQRPSPYPSAPPVQDSDMTPGQQRAQSNPSTPGGQMCRYVSS